MLNIHELERRWLRYRIKRVLPMTVALLSTLIFGIAALLYWPLFEAKQPIPAAVASAELSQQLPATPPHSAAPVQPVTNESVEVKPPVGTQELTAPSISIQEPVTDASHNVLRPSLDFMQSIEASAKREKNQPRESIPVAAEKPRPAPQPAKTKAPEPLKAPASAETSSPISITQQDASDLKDVVKRFEANKNPALSLFLARRYYDLQDFTHSYEYALKTNEIDSTIEESWLIFAKSLVKLGRNEEAVKTLGSYIQHSNSGRAKSLLDEINKGTFQ